MKIIDNAFTILGVSLVDFSCCLTQKEYLRQIKKENSNVCNISKINWTRQKMYKPTVEYRMTYEIYKEMYLSKPQRR